MNFAADHSAPRVLLVGNYEPDAQESMLRFARMLFDGLRARGRTVEIISPDAILGRWLPSARGLGKWLAYVDKFVLFPWKLRRRVRALGANAVVQICDHSNAMYIPAAASAGHPVLVVCHDLGAVRGALGEATDVPASRTGRVLQRWIARSLGRADLVACVSTATRLDVQRLIRRSDGLAAPRTELVFNGMNAPFHPLDIAETRARLASIPGFDPTAPFVLNVGSSLPRKNRAGVVRIFARLKDEQPVLRLVFAGEALTTDATLEALYNSALALLFPSRFEGFGWPAVEAQACGCPVLCSDAGSLPEVVAESAFVRSPDDEEAFAEELRRLLADPAVRDAWADAGFRNATRFETGAMIDRYLQLHDALLGNVSPVPAVR